MFNREEIYIDLTVVDSSVVQEKISIWDREALIDRKQENHQESIRLDEIIQQDDESVYIRGVGGTGKTTMLEMFVLRWAKRSLKESITPQLEFVFLFTCREINFLDGIKTIEQLFKQKFPEVFSIISLADLESIADRVLIIIDGLDELQDINNFHNTDLKPSNLSLVSSLVDTNNGVLKNHKVIACGRPKACEFVKQKFLHKQVKTIEVCGFKEENVIKYIDRFFNQNKDKAIQVKKALKSSSNLKVMATVPVFLWVICSVYSEELITKPLNTYTELYTYSTLIFLRNHFRGDSQQKNMPLFEVLNCNEIMNSVYALMKLSVQTYMENKVLFTDSDLRRFSCATPLEKTGFIVKYNRGGHQEAVYQFKHLVLQEFFCGLRLSVKKWVSPYLQNRELLSCAPIIFGIHRLLKENENKLFVGFFRKLLDISRSRQNLVTKAIVAPFHNFIFQYYILQNSLEIPSCMIKGDVLTINATIPECQEFMLLLYESGMKLECPFTSAEVIGNFSATDLRNAIYMLKCFKLKLKIPDFMVKNETLTVSAKSSIFAQFVNEDGIEIDTESANFIRFKVDSLTKVTSKTVIVLAEKLAINILHVPETMMDKDKNKLFIDENLPSCTAFIELDNIKQFPWSCPAEQFEFAEIIYCKDKASIISDFIQRRRLTLKLPSCMISNGVFYMIFESKVLKSFMKVFRKFQESDLPAVSTPEVSYVTCQSEVDIQPQMMQRLLYAITRSNKSLRYIWPDSHVNIENEFILNEELQCLNSMKIVNFWKLPLHIDLTYARLHSSHKDTYNFIRDRGIKVQFPEVMIQNEGTLLSINFGNSETLSFVKHVAQLRLEESMLQFDERIASAEVIEYGTEDDLFQVLYLLQNLKVFLKVPCSKDTLKNEFVVDPNNLESYNFMWLVQKLQQPLVNITLRGCESGEFKSNRLVYEFCKYAKGNGRAGDII